MLKTKDTLCRHAVYQPRGGLLLQIKKIFRRGFLICKEIFFSDYEYMHRHMHIKMHFSNIQKERIQIKSS
jgi:hypothetical protein